MKKSYLILLVLFTHSITAFSQVCTGIFTLRTQTEVNSFALNSCSTIEGSLLINSTDPTDPIVDLSPLSFLSNITQALQITQNDQLTSLNGLQGLNAIGPQEPNSPNNSVTLLIQDNANLTSIEALSNLSFLRLIIIDDNPNLSSLEGLQNITNVSQVLQISNNPILTDVNGLRGLSIGDVGTGFLFVNISNNNQILNLDGFQNWIVPVADLTIVDNGALEDITGLSGIFSSGSTNPHDITGNTSMTEFCGLFNFASTAPANTMTFLNNGVVTTQQEVVNNGSCFVTIQDNNFEQALVDQNIDTDGTVNGRVLRVDVEPITDLSISGLNISNLQGIEAFRNLIFLEASFNQITSVNLSSNANLSFIDLSDNQLLSIDVSANPDLFSLIVNNNQLTSLDVSNNNDISEVRANGNSLQTFVFNGNTQFTNVQLSGNQLLGDYDFSGQLDLFQLRVDGNLISDLVLPASSQMETLIVSNNPNLSILDVSVITSNFFDIFEATNLPNLDCIQVRDVNEANNEGSWTKDASTTYSEDCSPNLFVVRPTIIGAGNSPNFEIEEGDSFQLSFEALTNQSEGQQFNVTLNTDGSTAFLGPNQDFNFDIAEANFTVSAINNPDGSVNFTSLIDNFANDEDEVIIINLPRPTANYQWENANPDGSVSFTILLRSRTEPIRIGISVFEETNQLSPNEYVSNGTQPAYLVEEGNKDIILRFDALNLSEGQTLSYSVEIETPFGFGNAEQFIDYSPIDGSANLSVVDSDFDTLNGGSVILRIRDDDAREFTETLAVRIRPTTPLPDNTILVDYNNGVEGVPVDAGEEFTLWIDIRDDDNISAPFVLRATLSDEVNGDANSYNIDEGETFEIQFEALAPASENFIYRVAYSTFGSTVVLDDGDYNRGGDIIDSGNLIVNNANPDGRAIFEILDNDGEDPGERLVITLRPDNEEVYTWEGANSDGELVFDILINDPSTQPFSVTPSITGNVTGTFPNFEIEEGQLFNLSFNANALASDGTPYNPVIEITQNGNDASGAFTIDDLDKSFTATDANPDGSIQFSPNDDGNDTGNEVYTITITSENTGQYTIAQPTSFTITVTDRPNNAPILLQTTVVGATPDGADYRITEGQTLGIQIEALNGTNGETFTIPLDLSNTTAQAADYSGPETSFQVTIDNTQDPDGVLSYGITANDGDEVDEILDIILEQPLGYQWQSVGGNGSLNFRITIEDEDTGTNANVVAVLTNTGGMESESAGAEQRFDEITLQLFDEDGNEFTSTETITFEVNFNTEGIADEEKAEDGDFVPEKQTFTIPAGSSSDTIQVIYPREDPDDLVHDFYNVDIVSVNASFPIGLPSRLTAKILDISAPFTVEVRFRGIADLDDSGGPECCIYRRVEENSIIRFDFFAEKGVPTAMNYRVQIVTNNEPEDADEGATPATFRVDFTPSSFNEGTEGVFPYNGFPDERDGTWNVRIEDDNIPDELESFRIDFEDVSANLENSTQNYSFEMAAHKFDFTIIEAIPANIELVNNDDTLNEEEPGDFLQLRIYLETPSNDDVTVSFEIDGDENNNDFTISSQNTLSYDETTNAGNITLFSGNGVQEAFITITSINEPQGQEVNEGAEEFIFSLIDGFGYKLGNSIVQTVTLIDDDQADFDVVLSVPVGNETIFEDNTRPTTSFFEISLLDGMTNTSNSPLPINFEIIPNANGEPQLVTDYRIYDGEPSLGREITNETMKSVTVETGAGKGYIYVVATEDDGEIEEPEAINIRLGTGVGYNLPSPNNTETITIISKEQDTSTLNPANISATVSSATCPDVSEGEISMTNSSPFVFTVDLLGDDGQRLNTGTLEDFTINPIVLFEDLAPGEYQLKLSTDTPDIFPPNFTLSVRNNLLSTQLVSSSVDKSRNEAALVVSGSSYYEVRVNDRKYEFEFESESQNTLMVPLENGTNEILVDGLAPCQGTLKSTLTLANYKVFPNPSPSKINFSGFTSETRIDCYLFDGAGRLVLSTSTISNGLGEFELDVANLPQGTYLGQIEPLGHRAVQVKLLKN